MYFLEPTARTVRENQHLPSANCGSATAEALLLKTIASGGSASGIPRAIIKSYWWSHNLRGVVRGTASWM